MQKESKPTIYIVDDDADFQTALARLLAAANYKVTSFHNADDFLNSDFGSGPACILLDVNMPGLSGLELMEELVQRGSTLPVIFLTGFGDIPLAVQAMKDGAVDFLSKPVRHEELFSAINNALEQQAKHQAHDRQHLLWRRRYHSLTPREIEVFQGVVAGKLNKVIADELNASERTIKAHRASVMRKMQVGSLADLVDIAVQLGVRGSHPIDNPEYA